MGSGTTGGASGRVVTVASGDALIAALAAARDDAVPVTVYVDGTISPANTSASKIDIKDMRDVSVIDGSGAPARAADVLVRDGRIVRIGRVERGEARGARIVEGEGRVLAPGFIDLHTHGNPLNSSYQPFLAMGVTTVVLGQDGGSPGTGEDGNRRLPAWMDEVDRSRPDINVATCSGHGTLRRQAGIDDGTRSPSQAETARMVGLKSAARAMPHSGAARSRAGRPASRKAISTNRRVLTGGAQGTCHTSPNASSLSPRTISARAKSSM